MLAQLLDLTAGVLVKKNSDSGVSRLSATALFLASADYERQPRIASGASQNVKTDQLWPLEMHRGSRIAPLMWPSASIGKSHPENVRFWDSDRHVATRHSRRASRAGKSRSQARLSECEIANRIGKDRFGTLVMKAARRPRCVANGARPSAGLGHARFSIARNF